MRATLRRSGTAQAIEGIVLRQRFVMVVRMKSARSMQDEIDAMRSSEAMRAEQIARLYTTLQHVDQGIMMVDSDGFVVCYNDRLAEVLDLPASLLASRPTFLKLLEYQWTTEEFSRTDEGLKELIREGRLNELPALYERERPNGVTFEVRTQFLSGGAMVRTFTDITERKRAQAIIERAALYDDLTGLPTRLNLHRTLEKAIETGSPQPARLLYLSLDRFRLLNDARGHEFGDRVLIDVARRLVETCPAGGMVSRVGGDEFAILYPAAHPVQAPDEIPERLLRHLAEPHVIEGGRLWLTASIGIVSVEPGGSASALLRHADIALNRAKDAGGNRFSSYTPSMTDARQERFQLEQSLREALGSDAFQLAYQPVVDVENGNVVGFEALLRWTDRVRGDVPPSVFIPIAEATGLIIPLGRSVLEWACFEAASWTTDRTIAVNLSPAQFWGDDIVEAVRNVLTRSGLAPERLDIEVTEGMLLEKTSGVLETMQALCQLGVTLTLDDFGAGHAGLSYLGRFPFKKLKIDGSFIRRLGCDREADAIVEAILLLGRRLDMSVVAESVETASQLEQLREMRCPYVQGDLTGRPMSPEKARGLQR